MAWIKVIQEGEAQGPLKETYDAYMAKTKSDGVANILKVHGLHDGAFEAHYQLYQRFVFGKGKLRRYQREMIGTHVSRLNHCFY